MKPNVEKLAELKEQRRLKDVRRLSAGEDGRKIARRNASIAPESARKARIVFA